MRQMRTPVGELGQYFFCSFPAIGTVPIVEVLSDFLDFLDKIIEFLRKIMECVGKTYEFKKPLSSISQKAQ